MSRALLTIIAVTLIICCSKDETANSNADIADFIRRHECGLFGHGGFLFKYSAIDCQWSVNIGRKQLRMQSDDQKDYLNMVFADFPVATSNTVTANILYRVGTDEIECTCQMQVVKFEDNKFWLWDKSNGLGVIYPAGWTTGK